ncbi:monovalent cation/H+ antiporter subunit D family protein [Desulfobaculum bizertense]|uniref:monovalent cation/H+ antiporter subunit D family protein n=1 Tax=Desulfobaculum bizertense TaxID=376490 RepID=UPI001F36B133|nr:monovalent cation/H+ antiporter subunit D family protein [Desulfobaculum bizertense]UIJ39131.1 monovalent cation/H+ antiporter subunit D family protein [Desulfobaculum bizertense]
MQTIESIRPLLAVCVSLGVMPIIASCGKSPNAREAWTFIAAGIKLAIIASMVPAVLSGIQFTCEIFEVIPGVPLAFKVDAFGLLFALVSSSLWIVTSLYSIGYMRAENEHSQTRYFCFFALALSSTIGVAFSANLLTMYMFYEILSLSTYPLVTHHQDREARSSGRKYLMYIMGTSIGLALPAMLIAYFQAGTLDFGPNGFLAGHITPTMAAVLLTMFLFGFAKVGLMPVHSWLPAAMVAPTPVSALLHAVAVVKVGAFSILRVVTGVFGVDLLSQMNLSWFICTVASVTVITASLIALSQDGLKRRLAFSTIGQLAYIVLGLGLLAPHAVMGAGLHIAMHAFGKITLFMCAGAIFVATGKKNISEMVGIGKRMPVTMFAFLVGSLSVIGIPPTGGFLSKWYLLLGTMEANQWPFMVVLLVSSILNAAYFLPIVYKAFFCTKEECMFNDGVKEAPVACVAPLVITATCSVILFFYPDVFLKLAALATGVTP